MTEGAYREGDNEGQMFQFLNVHYSDKSFFPGFSVAKRDRVALKIDLRYFA